MFLLVANCAYLGDECDLAQPIDTVCEDLCDSKCGVQGFHPGVQLPITDKLSADVAGDLKKCWRAVRLLTALESSRTTHRDDRIWLTVSIAVHVCSSARHRARGARRAAGAARRRAERAAGGPWPLLQGRELQQR